MFVMYIIKSLTDKKLYIGSTSNLKKRLLEHNSRKVRSTKARGPFKLVYAEAYAVEYEARHREHNLKLRARAWRQLAKRTKLSLAS